MRPLSVVVLDDYVQAARRLGPWDDLPAGTTVDVYTRRLRGKALQDAVADAEVVCLMRERTPVDEALLASMPRVRLLVTTGMVNAAIDLRSATSHGVLVCGTTSSSRGPAELTIGHMIGLARHITLEDRAVRNGRWQTRLGASLHGRCLGLLGLGAIGSEVARLARALGMRVFAWSPHLDDERASAVGAERFDLPELLRMADFVSIHLRLGEHTRGLLGREELASMKPTAFLVNTSRAPIVDGDALVQTLSSGGIAGAALDVFDTEPIPPDHPLLSLPNVVLSPHVGYVTEQLLEHFYVETVEDVSSYLAGTPVRVLNPELLSMKDQTET